METRFDSKSVLITGASRGIGRAAARLFASAGARVAVHYHSNRSAAETVLDSLEGSGHVAVQADMGNAGQVQRMAEHILSVFGGIDILVNNAGIFEEIEMTGISTDEFLDYWDRTLRVNLTGPAILSNLMVREMIRSGGGKIVNVTSRGAFRGEPDAWAYGASKAGLNSLGQSMARALAKHNIQVFTLAPGYVDTDMSAPYLEGDRRAAIEAQSPMNRMAQPEEIARAILMLSADGMEYMTGCIVDMNGASYLRM